LRRIRQTADGQQWISTREITEEVFGSNRVSQADVNRRAFGASLGPDTIESCIRRAELGFMRDLTDLTKETINFDPHLASVIGKRFRSLASITPKVIDADGDGVDAALAKRYADEVRAQLLGIRGLRQRIINLDWAHCLGRGALEKVWVERRVGDYQYSLAGLNWIHPRRIALGPMREFRIRDDLWDGAGFEARGLDIAAIPHKFICYAPQLYDEVTEREGFGPRALYWSFFKRFSWRERMILLEVFGKPWRIIDNDGTGKTTPEELDDAQERADELGANNSAAFPAGMKLRLENADPKSTDPHRYTSQDCDDQISKLVLGGTRTTDAKAGSLGQNADESHQDAEDLVKDADSWGISEALTYDIARDFVVLNYGEEQAVNAPRIELPFEQPPDQTEEIGRCKGFLDLGIPCKVDELYTRSGFTKPTDGDEVITKTAPSPAPALPGDGGLGIDPSDPLAQARSLRLSRMSSDYFSKLS
jgi:phage gp29-like protein